jgi:mannose-6-phosphate isomerase-like protein (cupin superfamily)
MEPTIIRADELKENDFGDTKVIEILNMEWPPNFGVTKVRKVGDDVKLESDMESDLAYYVLEEEGLFVIEGNENKVKKGDLVFIPKGTKYKSLKGFTLLAIASPRFDRGKRRRIDE